MSTTHSGYTGSGFVDTVNTNGTWIEWSLDVPNATDAFCVFRYACASDARAMDLSINGNTVATLSFPASEAWTTWSTEEGTGSLNAGSNTIRLTATTSAGGPNMDKMDITVTIPSPANSTN